MEGARGVTKVITTRLRVLSMPVGMHGVRWLLSHGDGPAERASNLRDAFVRRPCPHW